MSFTLNSDYEQARAASELTFAADVLEDTLIAVREANLNEQWPLPLSSEVWDCDWEEAVCPVCGHDMDRHNSRDMTRCANAR